MKRIINTRRSLGLLIASLAALHTGCATLARATVGFDRHEVVFDSRGPQTLLTGSFLDGEAEQAVVVQVEDEGPTLRLYGLEGASLSPLVDATLGRDVLFVDVARIGDRDRLITYEAGRVNWFDPESSRELPLVDLDADYRVTEKGRVPHLDVTRDLTGDGRDDLIVPQVDGFWVSAQLSDGTFAEPIKLGPPEPFRAERIGGLDVGEPRPGEQQGRTRIYGEVGITAQTLPVYLSRVHRLDYNQDGRSDLVFWNEDHFDVYPQGADGRFALEAITFTTEVPFDTDGTYTRAFEYRDQGVASIIFGTGPKTRQTVLHSLRDLDGDGTSDLVTLEFTGRSIARQRSVYRLHRGIATADGVVFQTEAAAAIQPEGRGGAMQPWGYASQHFGDFDGDGLTDVMFREVRVGPGGMIRALVGNSVALNLEFHRNQGGSFSGAPTVKKHIRNFRPFAGLGNVFLPPVLLGDVNGDGRADLLAGRNPKEMDVFLGVAGPELLARRPERVAIDMPPDERRSRLADFNGDGKQDVLVHHTPTRRRPDAAYRLSIWVAR